MSWPLHCTALIWNLNSFLYDLLFATNWKKKNISFCNFVAIRFATLGHNDVRSQSMKNYTFLASSVLKFCVNRTLLFKAVNKYVLFSRAFLQKWLLSSQLKSSSMEDTYNNCCCCCFRPRKFSSSPKSRSIGKAHHPPSPLALLAVWRNGIPRKKNSRALLWTAFDSSECRRCRR